MGTWVCTGKQERKQGEAHCGHEGQLCGHEKLSGMFTQEH